MKLSRLFAALVGILSASPALANDNDGWVEYGYSRQTSDPAAWVKLKNIEIINPDSFKLENREDGAKTTIKINCKNKDISYKYYGGDKSHLVLDGKD